MKNTFFLIKFYTICICFIALSHKNLNDRTFVKITETENYYELRAAFDAAKSKDITAYMDESITGHRDFSFKNAQLDATVTLDSKIIFYVKSHPGELELKFDKRQNSAADYSKFKKMCEGIKEILSNK